LWVASSCLRKTALRPLIQQRFYPLVQRGYRTSYLLSLRSRSGSGRAFATYPFGRAGTCAAIVICVANRRGVASAFSLDACRVKRPHTGLPERLLRDHAAERTHTPHAVMEAALAHVVKNKAEAAYAQRFVREAARPDRILVGCPGVAGCVMFRGVRPVTFAYGQHARAV